MKLVIDANVIFSATISKGLTRKLLLTGKFELFAPEFLRDEIGKYAEYIADKSNNSVKEVILAINDLFEAAEIQVFATPELSKFIENAKDICPDPKDTYYFALALKLNCPIWSNDKELKKQDSVKVYSTNEILKI